MQRPEKLKIGDKFRVIGGFNGFKLGEIVSLKRNDGTDSPLFWNADKSDSSYMSFSQLEPLIKSVRNAQVGEVVVDRSGSEYMVLERGQNTVVLSYDNNFKKADDNFHFDELEEHFTLKAEPEAEQRILSMNEIAEKFGIEVSK